MKKIIFTTAFAMGVFFAQAQITITRSDIANNPAKIRYNVDEGFFPSNIQDAGSGKVWDFKALKNNGESVNLFDNPSNYPDYSKYPTSNLVIVIDSGTDETILYTEDSNDSIVVIGTNVDGTEGIRYRQLIFPMSMGTSWSDKSQTTTYYSGAEFGQPAVDSVRLTIKGDFINSADAEGTLKFSSGSIDALKLISVSNIEYSADVKYMGVWQSGTPDKITDTTYSFFSKNNGLYVATLSSNGDGTFYTEYKQNIVGLASVNKIKQLENAVRVYPNPTTQYLNIESAKADTYIITDILGKNIIDGNTASSIDVSVLAKGNYIIQLFHDGQLVSVNKFIKE